MAFMVISRAPKQRAFLVGRAKVRFLFMQTSLTVGRADYQRPGMPDSVYRSATEGSSVLQGTLIHAKGMLRTSRNANPYEKVAKKHKGVLIDAEGMLRNANPCKRDFEEC